MTAIYLMWNNNGFALAADSNQTANAKNITWVDSVEKIVKISGHQVAFGSSGNASLEGVEVNEIIRAWSQNLGETHKDTFEDYITDFLVYFANLKLPRPGISEKQLEDWFTVDFSTIKDLMEENDQNIEKASAEYIVDARHNVWNLNLLGNYWDQLVNTKDWEDSLNDQTRQKIARLEKVREEVKRILGRSTSFVDQSHFEYFSEEWLGRAFFEVFKRDLDLKNSLDREIVRLPCIKLEHLLDFDAPINFIFVGYGKNDWLPVAYVLKVYRSVLGSPRIAVSQIATSETEWFLSIAIETGVNELIRGTTETSRERLTEVAKPHIKKGHLESFREVLNNEGNTRFRDAMAKIDLLTLDRLEYVGRLFVQIEALQSYLNEPVPGVGGDTKIISMTKTTSSEKLIKEMP